MEYKDRIDNFERVANMFIKRRGIDSMLEYLRNSDFYTAPCSTKYHLCREGGLVEHSLNVFNLLFTEVACHNLTGFSDETIAIVSLFHDVCKIDCYKKTYRWAKGKDNQWYMEDCYTYDEQFPYGHGEKSAMIVSKYLDVTPYELQAINAHMGFSDSRGALLIGNIFKKNKLAVALHFADMAVTYFMEE